MSMTSAQVTLKYSSRLLANSQVAFKRRIVCFSLVIILGTQLNDPECLFSASLWNFYRTYFVMLLHHVLLHRCYGRFL